MEIKYIENAKLFKVLSDPTRLCIVEMISCYEMCACDILEKFSISQPTLSHHMRILCDAGLVNSRREGKWTYYSLDESRFKELQEFFYIVTNDTEDCLCYNETKSAKLKEIL